MDLYLLRHAEAGQAPRDEDRELTDHGKEQADSAAAGIMWLDLELSAVLSSPLRRAVQTAEPVARALDLKVKTADALAPGRGPAEVLAMLAAYGDRVLLVGHEPQMSSIVQAIMGGRVHMRKAMLAYLEVESIDPPSGALGWLLAPRHLKRMRRS
jgi:phosphohistidine phosphatase